MSLTSARYNLVLTPAPLPAFTVFNLMRGVHLPYVPPNGRAVRRQANKQFTPVNALRYRRSPDAGRFAVRVRYVTVTDVLAVTFQSAL